MHYQRLLAAATLVLIAVGVAPAHAVQVDFITQYCNENIGTAILADQPRMLRNISNSLLTAAPAYLDQAEFLRRRNNFSLCPDLEGIGELAQDWLRPNRVTIDGPAVVLVAIREEYYQGAGTILYDAGWRPLSETISLGYYQDPAELQLYAGLVNAGPVEISGSEVDLLRDTTTTNTSLHHYFFFQDLEAFSPEFLEELQVVSVPEPSTVCLGVLGMVALVGYGWRVPGRFEHRC